VRFGATFLVFSDYMRPPIRLAALMGLHVIYGFTHDSIALGEDGSTHQPVEQLASLRAIPRLIVIRPGDANETAAAWRVALATRERPVALVLTRQNLPTLDRAQFSAADGLQRGGYILADAPNGKPDVILIASGSEVSLIVAAREQRWLADASGQEHRFHQHIDSGLRVDGACGNVGAHAAQTDHAEFHIISLLVVTTSTSAAAAIGSSASDACGCRRQPPS
jgi:hypothetical protein